MSYNGKYQSVIVQESSVARVNPGLWNAQLTDITDSKNVLYGDSLKFKFVINDNGEAVVLNSFVKPHLSPGKGPSPKPTKYFLIVKALLGKAPEINEVVDLNSLIGRWCQVLVKDKEGTQFQTISDFLQVENSFVPPKEVSPLG